MLRRAAEHGLVIDQANPLPQIDLQRLPSQHDSMDGLWEKVGRYFDEFEHQRPIGAAARASQGDPRPEAAGREMLHSSLVERLGEPVSIVEETDKGAVTRSLRYEPPNVAWRKEEIRGGAGLPVFTEGQ
jgi:hypothetical protein